MARNARNASGTGHTYKTGKGPVLKPRRYSKIYYVYITASISRVIYTGMTNSLYHRIKQHKEAKDTSAFTARYRSNRLVYYEEFDNVYDPIDREKQIKRWRREKKLYLINKFNPEWKDLSLEWL